MSDRRRQRMVPKHKWLRALAIKAWHVQGGQCCHCKEPLRRNDITVEHIVPQRDHGGNHEGNIAAACFACNNARRHLPYKQFQKQLKGSEPADHWAIRMRGVVFRLERRIKRAEQLFSSIR